MKLKFDTKKAQPFFGALAASWLCLAPVWADDTEIFFAETTESNVWPNVLFVIDTSGSMRNEVDDPNNPDKDRLEHVQEAMRTVLTELNEVNVGLMRFSNPGGPVLFPVTRLDQEIVRDPMVTIVSEVSSDDDDASEIRSSNVVLLNDNTLYLTSALVGGSTWTSFIDEWEDDAEEDIDDGDVTRNSNDLDFYGADNGSARIIGLHFRGSDIPNGATINSAFIQFTGIDGGDSDQADAIVYGEDLDGPSDNIGSFGSGDDNLSDRDLTTASVAWTVTDSVADGDKITTPDLSAIVQEVVNDSGWDPGSDEDDMNFLIYPTGNNDGHKRFVSLQDDDAAAIEDRATLVVNYGATSTEDVVSAMRFQNVNVPKGVDVTNAYIEFVAPTNSAGAYDLVIYGEDSSTPAAFTDSNGDISGRSPASTTVAWSGSDSVDAGDTFRTPDISGIVQEIAARSDWCGGDAMVLAVNGSPGPLSGFSHDGDPTQSARLVVTYDLDTVPEGTSCFNDVASRRVTSSLDDAEENGSDVSITGDTLNLESGNNIGVRFRGLDVPKDATIKRAYLEFTARDDDDGNTTLTIAVESTDDADSYQGVDDTVDGRSYGGSVSWSITEDWDDDSTYRSPDIKALVQSIVDRSGWAAGNAMAFRVVNSGSNDREAFSFNRSPGDAPRLVVEFESDGTGDEIYTARDELLSIIDTLSHNGYTPIQDTMYEAAQYYTGGEVLYGKARGADDGGPFAYTRVSSEGAMVPGTFNINYPDGCSAANLDDEACADQTITGVGGNPKYESPITNACQGNHIILLTDGYPNRDNSESLVQSFIGSSSCTDTGAVDDDGDVTGGVCVQDLVKHIANTDQSPLGGDQLIKTHPIGFAFSDDWLRNLAGQDNGADPDA
ncbi:MAG: VWA domain-containing protein, partial [Pseudomonadota bacterium]